jgi:hypothetical protein
MAKNPKQRSKVVTMERYTNEAYQDEILLCVSGGGISGEDSDSLADLLEDIEGVETGEVVVTRWYARIRKHDDAEWPTIVPAVKKVLAKVFGRSVHVTERTRRKMSEGVEMTLMEANAESFRETFQGCALTEDECDALGIDFYQHNLELRGVDY